jgi:NADP-dependent 3-hydroxy acid dehydrogenase YdfG
MQPSGQVVAITGASGGIGAAAGRLLAARGDRVVLAARRERELSRVAEEIAAAGGEASTCVVDVASREDLHSLVEHATGRFGRLDALVANAGIATTGPAWGRIRSLRTTAPNAR